MASGMSDATSCALPRCQPRAAPFHADFDCIRPARSPGSTLCSTHYMQGRRRGRLMPIASRQALQASVICYVRVRPITFDALGRAAVLASAARHGRPTGAQYVAAELLTRYAKRLVDPSAAPYRRPPFVTSGPVRSFRGKIGMAVQLPEATCELLLREHSERSPGARRHTANRLAAEVLERWHDEVSRSSTL